MPNKVKRLQPKCPHCGNPMGRQYRPDGQPVRNFASHDHIMPLVWIRRHNVKSPRDITNTRTVCLKCNRFRAAVGHCVGAMACLMAISDEQKNSRWEVYKSIKNTKSWIKAIQVLNVNLEALQCIG